MNDSGKTEERPHYLGHRDRLREKFGRDSSALADYEVLELLLSYAIPRVDVKPVAKALLKKFNSYAAVFTADASELEQVAGIKERTALFLKAVHEAHCRALLSKVKRKTVLDNWDAIVDFLRMQIGTRREEVMCFLWLNKQLELIEFEEYNKGTVDAAVIYPQEVAKKGISRSASSLVMAHNHPTGLLKPSAEDIETTNDVRNALFSVNINLFDHLIISQEGYYSFKDKGYI